MKHPLKLVVALWSTCLPSLHAKDAPSPESPSEHAVIYTPHPHFYWRREADVKIDEVHHIQIARDEAFVEVVCDDRLEVVSRFVPVKALPPARYWWRVRSEAGDWSRAVAFELRSPEKTFLIRAGSDGETVKQVLLEAAANAPARVDFEPGKYALAPDAGESLVTMTKAHDLVIDGHGAHLVLAGTFLNLNDCQRVTVQRFRLTPARPAYTLVRVTKKDPDAMNLTVRPEPGHAPDVTNYFQFPGTVLLQLEKPEWSEELS